MGKHNSKEDSFLLSVLCQGDKKAFDTLFRKYYPMLCAYCLRFVTLEDAEEITSDVLVSLWEKRENLLITSSLSQYLLRAVYYRSMDCITRKQLKRKADTYYYEEMHKILQGTEPFMLEELVKRIRKAIDELPPSYREAFVMHRFRDMTYKEIGEVLSISHKTVDYRMQQALKLLRIELKDYLPLYLPLLMYFK